AGSRALPADRAAPHRARRRDRCGHAVGGPVARAPHAIGPPLRRPHPRPLSFARRGEWPSPPAPLLPGSGLNGLPGTPLNGSRLCLATPLRLAIHAAGEGEPRSRVPPFPRREGGRGVRSKAEGRAEALFYPPPRPFSLAGRRGNRSQHDLCPRRWAAGLARRRFRTVEEPTLAAPNSGRV